MSVDYSSTALIANVKRRCSTPTSQSLFANTDFCALMSDEMKDILVPLIMSAKEDYFLTYKDYSIDGSTTTFAIPDRAIGQKVRNIDFYDATAVSFYEPTRTDLNALGTPIQWTDVGGYYIQDNDVIFTTAPTDTSKYVRMYYFRRPNNIIKTTLCGQITAINTGTKVVTLDNAPTTWTTSTTFDFIKGRGGFQSLGDDKVITAVSGFDLTFSATLPTGLAVGDWVAEAGESPIPQIPYEGHNCIAQLAAVKVLEALSDANMIKQADAKAQAMLAKFLSVIKDRVDGQTKKIVSRRGIFTHLRANKGW